CILCDKETDNVETSLKQQLFCNGYDPKKRPALDEFDTLNISSFSVLYQFEFFWTDSRLTWNASDWSNITNIQITHDEVWFPHFKNILSDYKGVSSLSCTNPNCNLYHTGSVYCLPVCTISAMCSPAYSRWPFNTVSCHMWFSNRDKELVDEINFLPMRTQMGLNASPGAWCLTSFEANTTTLEYPGAAVRTVEKFTFGLHHNPNTA
uniref:Neurotransmitter-gated ion-channel ligand-binding domain-containing protein n=1 Tax=Anopheles dirus TaxID=7168 RepID=A0A182N8N4_9DIPT